MTPDEVKRLADAYADECAAPTDSDPGCRYRLRRQIHSAIDALAAQAVPAAVTRISIPTETMEQEFQWHYSRGYKAGVAASTPAAPAQPVAWMHPDGRVVPASTKVSADRDGGAMRSSLSGYAIPLYASPQAVTTELQDRKLLALTARLDEAERVIRSAASVMRGDGVEDQGEAYDMALRLLDAHISVITGPMADTQEKPE